MIWIIFAAVAWYAIGIFSHVYWWTKKHNYLTGDLAVSAISGTLGPFNWIVGWTVMGEPSTEIVLLRRRIPQDTAHD